MLAYNNQIRMPLIYKSVDRLLPVLPPVQRVKREEPSIISEQSPALSGEEVEISGEENRQAAQGRWNEEENFKFVLFVHYYQDIFASRHKRKVCKIFRTFSEYLTDRSAAQCRSHYQKMILKHKTIAKLKKHYKLAFGDKHYNQQYEAFRAEWELKHPPSTKASEQIKQFKEVAIQTQTELQMGCELCGLKTESDFSANTSLLNPFTLWSDFSQFQNTGGVNYFYYFPQHYSTL